MNSGRAASSLTTAPKVSLAAVVLVIFLAACATASPRNDPFGRGANGAVSIRLDVENRNFYDATIYVMQDQGPARRVGDVGGNGKRSFQVPWEFAAAMSFRIDLLAGGSCTTPPVVVSPGEILGLQIVSNVESSSAYCR